MNEKKNFNTKTHRKRKLRKDDSPELSYTSIWIMMKRVKRMGTFTVLFGRAQQI